MYDLHYSPLFLKIKLFDAFRMLLYVGWLLLSNGWAVEKSKRSKFGDWKIEILLHTNHCIFCLLEHAIPLWSWPWRPRRICPFLCLQCALDCAWFVVQTFQCFVFFQLLVIPFIAFEFILVVSSDGMASIHHGCVSWGSNVILLVALLSRWYVWVVVFARIGAPETVTPL